MIALTVLICAAAAFAIGTAVGARLKQSRTTLNHFTMARTLERIVQHDTNVPILLNEERKAADSALADFWKRPPELDPRDQPRRKPLY